MSLRYFEHKTDSYKNNKRKIYSLDGDVLILQEPYSYNESGGIRYGFSHGLKKQVDEETLNKYYKEISREDFFTKQITHI